MRIQTVAAVALAVLPVSASLAQVSGTLLYTDYDNNAQPSRRVTVDVYAADGTTLLETVRTDDGGAYVSTVASPTGYLVRARALNDAASVADGSVAFGAPGYVNYTVDVGTIGAAGGAIAPVTFNARTGTNAERAFAVADPLQTSWLHSAIVRPAPAPVLPTVFGNVDNTGASFFDGTNIQITQRRRFSWDVLGHEYGHYLGTFDALDVDPGGDHSFGVSNIPANPTAAQKFDGVALAWGEGVASYVGLAAQALAARPNSPTVGNSAYESFDADLTPNELFGADLESATTLVGGSATVAVGEGDELTTGRVLWDLADATNEAHDRITQGHVATYQQLVAKSYDNVGELWTDVTATAADALRVDYGGIFMLNGASPDPEASDLIGDTLVPADAPPTFEWLKGNDDANDLFGLIVWNADFTTRLLDLAIAGDVTSYTLTAAQWNALNDYNGLAQFIINGSDTSGFATPGYWSDAYSFTINSIVPEPASLATLGIVGSLLMRRRRDGRVG